MANMLRVALVSAPLTLEERYGKFASAGNTQPTYALPCLGAIALQEGADVRLVDASARGLEVQATAQEIVKFHPDLVGITSTTVGICASGELARQIKEKIPQTRIVIGGCHVTALPVETLSEFSGFDLAVIGEGEVTFAEMLSAVKETGSVPGTLAGAAVRQDGHIYVNPPRPFIQNLDELPLPAWELLPGFPLAFVPSPARIRQMPCASVVFARGCPNQCRFCDRSVFGNKVRAVSPAYAIQLVKSLRDRFGVKELLIEDDTFIISRDRVVEFCERLIAEKLDITWSCLGRVDRANPEILRLMRRAGCWHISYGIESGDQKILDLMCKGETLAQVRAAIRLTQEAGIRTKGFFMLGLPGESQASLRLTQELALQLPLDDISVMSFTPFPGTAVFADVKRWGTFEQDWRKMNIVDTVFVPHGLTASDLDKARREMLSAFYLRPRVFLSKLLDAILRPAVLWRMVKAFVALLGIIWKREETPQAHGATG
jgi:anaerobic magnesium-protoporphyrin IX monomethyl ester cyclase